MINYLSFISIVLLTSFVGVGIPTAQANGFFEYDSPSSINNLSPIPYDDFFFDEYNPHNFYNPNNRLNSNVKEIVSEIVSGIVIEVPHKAEKSQPIETLSEIQMLFQDQGLYDSLERKSEQAMRKNTEMIEGNNVIKEIQLTEQATIESTSLSQLTGSTLIVSARKKQYYEKLFPLLLSNLGMTISDKQRLDALYIYFSQGNIINAQDNIWLKQLTNENFMIENMPELSDKADGKVGFLKP
ncbi:hypothetical protein [sulfur-oxidizing endosymbiont of Gigantopelta aegis]|uniref:hypothetical protein n=1 Tax=sulfur-oxidizing endosymbiont of Gigantopelta aegis TaxID=2794934 RepID=UPI0018DCA3F9|nr:hypothetical protein [sulfur-oxidizing endosymbiont of Gigantopelta aegis]